MSSYIAALLGIALFSAAPRSASAAERLCDPAFEDCRAPILTLIANERVEIDVAFWFMEDSRYSAAIIDRWNAGVRVRVLLDPRGDAGHPANADIRQQLVAAGIPIRKRTASGILHWKTMLFAGQDVVQFSGANYSPFEFVAVQPYANYEDESIYFSDDPAVVDSFKTKWDDLWTDTSSYADYANVPLPRTRHYPTYGIDPELNFPPGQDFATRSVGRYNAETQKIDATMFRITDQRHTNALIDAMQRGVTVRLITEQEEYRNPQRLWDAWNVDRLYAAGAQVRQRAHTGLIHQKSTILYSQGMTIFGSSNWTSPSANSQQEHNYFTTKSWIFQWFVDQFERKWTNSSPAGVAETEPFTPLPPDPPEYVSVANGATGVPASGVVLKWDGGPWAHIYDIYFGTAPTPPLFAANQNLGPDDPRRSPKQYQTFTLPTLAAGTTYYWRIVSKTMANMTASGPVWSFSTGGEAACTPGSGQTVVMWAANVADGSVHGNWTRVADSSAAGGSALENPDRGAAKITPALASPASYFETTFQADAGTAYHLWLRMRAENDSYSNDSVHVQFSDATDALGTAAMRIGTSSSAEVVLQDGDGAPAPHGWGWADNGWNTLGPDIYFAASGTHTIRIQQREDGAIVDQIVLSPGTYLCSAPGPRRGDTTILPATESGGGGGGALPAPWTDADIGAVPIAGSASDNAGTFRIAGSGADIWDTADAFHFVYQPMTGDVTIDARIASVEFADRWSKAGVMIRNTLDSNSAHAFMLVSAGKGVALQWRPSTGSTSMNAAGSTSTAPRWVRLVRGGNTVTGYESSDGSGWTKVGSATIALNATVYVGLAVTSHTTTSTTTAVADHVTVGTSGESGSGLPSPWTDRDIGAVNAPGTAGYDNGAFRITATGADIWDTSDAFHFVYQPMTGDVTIDARVASVEFADRWSKAGVMIRETLDAGSKHAFMLVSAGRGVAMQWRPSTGGASLNAAGSASTAPRWVRLVRSGSTITGYESPDGTTWTTVGTTTIPMDAAVYVGLAVTSHTTSASTTAVLDGVTVAGPQAISSSSLRREGAMPKDFILR